MTIGNEINELKNILIDFIVEQKKFNKEQLEFNAEQKIFNEEQKKFNKEQLEFNAEQKIFNAEQKIFNAEQIEFNMEQKLFNGKIIRKIDKAQYFLEESIAENHLWFFEEQHRVNKKIDFLDEELTEQRTAILDLTSQVKILQRSL